MTATTENPVGLKNYKVYKITLGALNDVVYLPLGGIFPEGVPRRINISSSGLVSGDTINVSSNPLPVDYGSGLNSAVLDPDDLVPFKDADGSYFMDQANIGTLKFTRSLSAGTGNKVLFVTLQR